MYKGASTNHGVLKWRIFDPWQMSLLFYFPRISTSVWKTTAAVMLYVIIVYLFSKDVNECLENHGGCDVHAKCINLPGSHSCVCDQGKYSQFLLEKDQDLLLFPKFDLLIFSANFPSFCGQIFELAAKLWTLLTFAIVMARPFK